MIIIRTLGNYNNMHAYLIILFYIHMLLMIMFRT